MKKTPPTLIRRTIAEEETIQLDETAQKLIDCWKDTREEVWLTRAALHCFESRQPIPPGIRAYIRKLLLDREKQVSKPLKKQHTKHRNEWFIREVRDLIFLTGANAEDACHRVSNVCTLSYGDRDKVPSGPYLYRLWNNRYSKEINYNSAEHWEKDPALNVSYVWALNWFGEYCKPEHGIYLKTKDGLSDKVTLEIKRELFE